MSKLEQFISLLALWGMSMVMTFDDSKISLLGSTIFHFLWFVLLFVIAKDLLGIIGRASIRFAVSLYRFLLRPLVRDYRDREENYREIIKGLQKQLGNDADKEAVNKVLDHMEQTGIPLYGLLNTSGTMSGLSENDPRVKLSVQPSGSAWAEQHWLNQFRTSKTGSRKQCLTQSSSAE